MLLWVAHCSVVCCVLRVVACCCVLCALLLVVCCCMLCIYKLLPSPLSGDGVPHELLQCVCVRQGWRVSVSANCVVCQWQCPCVHVCTYIIIIYAHILLYIHISYVCRYKHMKYWALVFVCHEMWMCVCLCIMCLAGRLHVQCYSLRNLLTVRGVSMPRCVLLYIHMYVHVCISNKLFVWALVYIHHKMCVCVCVYIRRRVCLCGCMCSDLSRDILNVRRVVQWDLSN